MFQFWGFQKHIINNIFEVRHEVLSLMLVLSSQPGHIVSDDCKMTIIKFVFEIVEGGKATGNFCFFKASRCNFSNKKII